MLTKEPLCLIFKILLNGLIESLNLNSCAEQTHLQEYSMSSTLWKQGKIFEKTKCSEWGLINFALFELLWKPGRFTWKSEVYSSGSYRSVI